MTTPSEQAEALAAQGRAAEGARLLEAAAANGDGLAAYTLANWRLSGAHIRRDLRQARDLFLQASSLGVAAAEPIGIALLANGAGGAERRWSEAVGRLRADEQTDPHAARQLKLLGSMAIDADGDPLADKAGVDQADDPLVRRYPGFLSPDECAYLTELAVPQLQPAVVINPQTGALVRDPVRTSTAAGFPFVAETPVLHAINRRIARATETAYEQGEPLQVLSYEPGQEYKLHSDALPGQANQRVVTFLVYLNNGYTGGETRFPDLGLTISGQVGEGLLFRNVDASGRPHPLARHAGLPVTSGRKLILSKWIRSQPLDLSGPPGRPL